MVIAGVISALYASVTLAANVPGYKLVNTHKLSPVSELGKAPTRCVAYPQSVCILKGAYGSVSFLPHILKPGSVLIGTVTPTSACHACAATWPVTGQPTDNVLEYLKRLEGCGPLRCRWQVAKDAPAEAYLVIEADLSPDPPANGPTVATGYAGIRSPYELEYRP